MEEDIELPGYYYSMIKGYYSMDIIPLIYNYYYDIFNDLIYYYDIFNGGYYSMIKSLNYPCVSYVSRT